MAPARRHRRQPAGRATARGRPATASPTRLTAASTRYRFASSPCPQGEGPRPPGGARHGIPRAAPTCQGAARRARSRAGGDGREHTPASIEIFVRRHGLDEPRMKASCRRIFVVCGVFGNITNDDIAGTISTVARRCPRRAARDRGSGPGTGAPARRLRLGPRVVRPPPASTRSSSRARDGFLFGVGVNRLAVPPARAIRVRRAAVRPSLPSMPRWSPKNVDSSMPWGTPRFSRGSLPTPTRSSTASPSTPRRTHGFARRRTCGHLWIPACHVRDVVRIQTPTASSKPNERDELTFTPMRHDERVVEDRYNEQDPKAVAAEIIDTTGVFVALLARLDDPGWSRTGIYNYPTPAPRTVEWIATHTSHELLHRTTTSPPRCVDRGVNSTTLSTPAVRRRRLGGRPTRCTRRVVAAAGRSSSWGPSSMR